MNATDITYEEYEAIYNSWQNPRSGTPEWKQFWHERLIPLAQRVKVYETEGQDYPRVPYGEEDKIRPAFMGPIPDGLSYAEIAQAYPCHDCAVVKALFSAMAKEVVRIGNELVAQSKVDGEH